MREIAPVKQTFLVRVPTRFEWNDTQRRITEHDVVYVDIEITVDMAGLARRLGPRAANSKRKIASFVHGLVKARMV